MNAPFAHASDLDAADFVDCPECAGEGFDYVLHGCRQDVVQCPACSGSGVAAVCQECRDNGPACECNAPGGYCDCAPCGACGGR